jgi:hypothetical protein
VPNPQGVGKQSSKNEAIEMNKKPQSVVSVAAFCLPLLLVASCGSEQGAPPGSTVTVSPDEVPWAVTLAACDNSVMQDTYFNIVVKSPSGAPLTGVDIRVSLALAPGTFVVPAPSVPVMYLYDDLDGDDIYTDLITVFPHFTNTGSSGTKMLRVQYDLTGCTYAGNLDVFSGSSYGTAHISVEEAT